MKILKFAAENVKGIKCIEITPPDDQVVLSGGNGAGKSTVLDSIQAVLVGGDLPLRTGEKRGSVEIQLGEYTLTRIVTEKTDRFVVKNKDGAAYPSPREFLSKIVGPISIDPLAFVVLKPRDQIDVLFGLLPELKDGLEAANKEIAIIKTDRSDIIRDQKRLEVEAQDPTQYPDQEQNLTSITLELTQAMQANRERAEARRAIDRKKADLKEYSRQRGVAQNEIKEIERQLAALQERLGKIGLAEKVLTEDIMGAGEIPPDTDTSVIAAKLDSAEDHNASFRKGQALAEKRARLAELGKRFSALGDELKEAEGNKALLLSTALMPIPGLSVDESAVTYNGIPISDLSTAEKVRVGASIAVAMNPRAKVILCDDASLLDSKSLAVLREICAGFQVWTVVNDENGKEGFFIESGMVREPEKKVDNVLKFEAKTAGMN